MHFGSPRIDEENEARIVHELTLSRAKQVQDEIQKLKYKDPTSTKIVQLEQELVRAEAQSLVAEAQLTNIVRLLPPLSLTISPFTPPSLKILFHLLLSFHLHPHVRT